MHPSTIIEGVVNGDIKDWQRRVRNLMLYLQCKSQISRQVTVHKNNQYSGNNPLVAPDFLNG